MTELNGKFYGTTQKGGAANEGFVFEFDPVAGTATQKADFYCGWFQLYIRSWIGESISGRIFGNTTYGGPNQGGYVFEFDPVANTITKRGDFPSFYGQSGPNMVEGPDGMFYGSGYPATDSEYFFDFNPNTGVIRIVSLVDKSKGQWMSGDFVLFGGKFLSFGSEGGGHNQGSVIELRSDQ
ncbi:MAG: choice-of-anchor tandem repeat GloVer-containing protein [Bacteroidota bacterium]